MKRKVLLLVMNMLTLLALSNIATTCSISLYQPEVPQELL